MRNWSSSPELSIWRQSLDETKIVQLCHLAWAGMHLRYLIRLAKKGHFDYTSMHLQQLQAYSIIYNLRKGPRAGMHVLNKRTS